MPWAADNDAFNVNSWDERAERRFVRMVEALSGLPGCLFVVCPDVVGDAGLTSLGRHAQRDSRAPKVTNHR